MPRWPSPSSRTPEGTDSPASVARIDPQARTLPPDAGDVLLPLARWAIEDELGLVTPRPAAQGAWLDVPTGTFVTLETSGRLHGCIGSLTPRRPLGRDVEHNARAAAVRDRRFPALTPRELADTVIEVSVLSPVESLVVTTEADALAALRPEVDGVVVECGPWAATFLPRMWDRLPDARSFLDRLWAKAGLPQGYWGDDVRLSRYTVTELREDPRGRR